jgi:RNA polymerase sigma factor (sigma-70 family)
MVAVVNLSEHEAIAEFLAARSERCFSAMARMLTPKLLRYFGTRGCDFRTAEEMTQDVLLACYRHAASIRNTQAFGAWLYRVARNVLLQDLRKRKREISTISLDSLRPGVHATIAPRFEFSDLTACLEEDEKELLALRYVDGFSYEEIGAMLNIPVGTAKWRVFNTKTKILAHAKERANRG